MWKALLAAAVLATLARDASPCSIDGSPSATAYGPTDKLERGHQPWVRVLNVSRGDGAIHMTAVAASCATDAICAKGTAIPFDHEGSFIRPRDPLADGTRVQVSVGKKLLGDLVVTKAKAATELPAWDGVELAGAEMVGEGLCSPAGPQIRLRVKPTKADLADAVLLVYLEKPDAKHPAVHVAAIYKLLPDDMQVELQSSLGNPWLAKMPKTLWVALADGDGHVGAPIELSPAPAAGLQKTR